jgi:wobble nucleotide-excising tRNase
MAQLERATTPPDIAVILDDPFQSQDAFRRNATAFQIKRCGDRCGQVIVLSHDANFLKLIWDELPTDARKALRLNSVGRTTVLSEWDIDEHLKEAHQANLDALQRFVENGVGKPRDVAQKLRPALEGYCKAVCPGQFPDGMTMGDIISKIRADGSNHPLNPVVDELEELNSYARRYHHASNPNAASEVLNEGELHGYSIRILRLMRVPLAA